MTCPACNGFGLYIVAREFGRIDETRSDSAYSECLRCKGKGYLLGKDRVAETPATNQEPTHDA